VRLVEFGQNRGNFHGSRNKSKQVSLQELICRLPHEASLPRYYFHLSHAKPAVDDFDGIELSDPKAAWEQATRACGEMIREIDGELSVGTDWTMEVHDAVGPLFRIHFGAEKLR
jgi:hypothetical protein